MGYIPKFLKTYPEKTNNIHQILYEYFSYEINKILRYHSGWLKYPIISNYRKDKNQYGVYCAENDLKVRKFLMDYPSIKFIEKQNIGSSSDDGVIYYFYIPAHYK